MIKAIKIKREMFSFSSEQDWINRARKAFANCGISPTCYIALDAVGHVMWNGKCFSEATKKGAYPVTVYELQPNWESA